jgi:hypothetical protein
MNSTFMGTALKLLQHIAVCYSVSSEICYSTESAKSGCYSLTNYCAHLNLSHSHSNDLRHVILSFAFLHTSINGIGRTYVC